MVTETSKDATLNNRMSIRKCYLSAVKIILKADAGIGNAISYFIVYKSPS